MIVLSGASASGKTEAAKMLMVKYGITKAITTTTRPMRKNEVNGKDYFFVTKEEFEQMIKDERFVEHTLYNGNYYGSTKDQIADGRSVVIDLKGLKSYSSLNNDSIVSNNNNEKINLVKVNSKIVVDAVLNYFDEDVKMFKLSQEAKIKLSELLNSYLSNH